MIISELLIRHQQAQYPNSAFNMPQYTINPNTRNATQVSIPGIGEFFVNQAEKDAGIEWIYRRTQDGITRIPMRDFIPGGHKTDIPLGQQLPQAYEAIKGQLGIDVNQLADYNIGDVGTALGSGKIVQPQEFIGQITTTPASTGIIGASPFAGAKGYTGSSIVDFLSQAGQPSDSNSRAALAKQYGISYDINATGDVSARQNTQLLNVLRSGVAAGTIPQSGITSQGGTPTKVTATPIKNLAGLYANTQIDALAKKIEEQSLALAAGISAGGSEEILSGLFNKFGIEEAQNVLTTYNQNIYTYNQRLKKLPEDLKNTLQDVGVSESQLNRLILKDSKPILDALNEAMHNAGAAQDRINQSLTFVRLFSDVMLADRAARLEGAKFELESNKQLLEKLDAKQKEFATLALDERKDILTMGNMYMQNGGKDQNVLNSILNSNSKEDALRALDASGFGVKLEKPKEIDRGLFTDKQLSINQIETFKDLYGWTPPFGFTGTQLQQYIEDNPGATPQELEEGARQATSEQTIIHDISLTADKALPSIMGSITDAQLKALKKKADEAGISSLFKSKRIDVLNYLNSKKDKIKEALDNGFSIGEIIEFLSK